MISKPASRGKPLATPPSETIDLAQRPVVHVHDAAPHHPADVDAELVAPVDVVVDQGGEQIVRRGDGVEVAGEVEVHVLHRHHLRVAAAGGAALHPEVRSERGLADAHDGSFADAVEPVAETDRGGRLAFARRRRVDRGDEDQLAVLAVLLRGDEFGRNLRLVVAVGQQVFRRDGELGADLHDQLLLRRAGDLDVGFHFGHDGIPSNWTVAAIGLLVVVGGRDRPPGEIARRSKLSAAAWSTRMQECFPGRNCCPQIHSPRTGMAARRIEPHRHLPGRLKTGAKCAKSDS